MALVQQNILTAFQELGINVSMVLQAHQCNTARINEQKRSCLQFLANIQQHLPNMSPVNAHTITTSIDNMISALESGIPTTCYPPDASPIVLGNTIHSGQRGRPPVDIKCEDLALLASGRTTMKDIADLYQCGARTIRRRMLEFGLSEPGLPVYTEQEQDDGSVERVYSRGSCANLSQATDEELDAILISIYEQFPSFGKRMIDGYLMALGE
ncbi:hypothetical protein BYT27DRAFT_7259298 [Phlegmacium glaucopus]|nr:hypothetical protein BYT27DRAFT_7259298 [Phlegmacium glaucopus]